MVDPFGPFLALASDKFDDAIRALREGKCAILYDDAYQKHDVDTTEAEQAFYDERLSPLGSQVEPEVDEPRFGILGRTFTGRRLHVVFTIRSGQVRMISARPMHRKERAQYEQALRQE